MSYRKSVSCFVVGARDALMVVYFRILYMILQGKRVAEKSCVVAIKIRETEEQLIAF